MRRESSLKEVKPDHNEQPEFGAGSEFGRKEREEAFRRKFEKRKNKYDNSPWILNVGGKHGKKYKGIREGGITDNASYFVLYKASDDDSILEAYPVSEWYKFTPIQRYKALSAEEAEEKFNKREQILNYFPLKHMTKKEDGGIADRPVSERRIKKEFKVSDMDDWTNLDDDNSSDDDSDEDGKKSTKEKKMKRRIKKESASDNEEAAEDSDEGDNDDKELDYMSDLSSSSESETEKIDIKGVEDELQDLIMTDDENEEGIEKPTDERSIDDKKIKLEDSNALIDSESDSDKPDDIVTSKEISSELKQKYKLENPGPGPSHSNKRQKVDKTNELVDIITKDVKRYLLRKPHTLGQLLKLCKKKVPCKRELCETLRVVLQEKLKPESYINHNGKTTFVLKQ